MSFLQPSACTCYPLKFPLAHGDIPLHKQSKALDYRTGASTVLAQSSIFVFGGTTTPLKLDSVSIPNVKAKLQSLLSDTFKRQSSKPFILPTDVFSLDLIVRKWSCLEARSSDQHPITGRLFHSMTYFNSALYIFGGLVLTTSKHLKRVQLHATNELWKLDLVSKTWVQIPVPKSVVPRFNHFMHVVEENGDNNGDARLIIVGGSNEDGMQLYHTDIFDLTTLSWELGQGGCPNSVGTKDDKNRRDYLLNVNINGREVGLASDTDLSVPIENTATNIPGLVVYISGSEKSQRSNIKRVSSTVATLPLQGNPTGLQIGGGRGSHQILDDRPPKLSFPSGGFYGCDVIIGGSYENCKFNCFTYSILTGKRMQVELRCPDLDVCNHRFWRLFVWKSHHQVLLLGTRKNDHLPASVQRFDHILSFRFPMINIFDTQVPTPPRTTPLSSISAGIPKISLTKYLENLDKRRPYKTLSHATKSASQFENYTHYISPATELASMSSIFTPAATFLGKNAAESHGTHLADLEFVSSEGQIVPVPMYLLRIRWGRYFQGLLTQAFASSSLEFEVDDAERRKVIGFSPPPYPPHSPRSMSDGSLRTDHHQDTAKKHLSIISEHKLGASISPTAVGYPYDTVNGYGSRELHPEYYSIPSHLNELTDFRRRRSSGSGSSRGTNSRKRSSGIGPTDISVTSLSQDTSPNFEKHHRDSGLKKVHSFLSSHNLRRVFGNYTDINGPILEEKSGGISFRIPFRDKKYPENRSRVEKSSVVSSTNPPKTTSNKRKSLFTSASSRHLYSGLISPRESLSRRRASHPLPSTASVGIDRIANRTNRQLYRSPLRFSRSSMESSNDSSPEKVSPRTTLNDESPIFLGDFSCNVLDIPIPSPKRMPSEPPCSPPLSVFQHGLRSNSNHEWDSQASRTSSICTGADKSTSMRKSVPKTASGAAKDHRESEDVERTQSSPRRNSAASISFGQLKRYIFKNRSIPDDNEVPLRESSLSSSVLPTSSASKDLRRLSLFFERFDTLGSFGEVRGSLLLVPRTLYMPWPTRTLRAFSEFFYTGQVNRNWAFQPTALDLLVISKLYEIPLLYNMLCEVFYTIIRRREQGLSMSCRGLRWNFIDGIREMLTNQDNEVEGYLKKSRSFGELCELSRTLEEIEAGILCINLLTSLFIKEEDDDKTFTGSESDCNDGPESDEVLDPADILSMERNQTIQQIEPKESLSTRSSPGISFGSKTVEVFQTSDSPRSRETILHSTSETPARWRGNQKESEDEADPDKSFSLSGDLTPESSTKTIGLARSAPSSEVDLPKVLRRCKSLSAFAVRGSEVDSQGLKKGKIRANSGGFDYIATDGNQSFHSSKEENSHKNELKSNNSSEEDTDASEGRQSDRSVTIESLASPFGPSPLDAEIKQIHRTTTLVNDDKLIVRCLQCLEISKRLTTVTITLEDELAEIRSSLSRKNFQYSLRA